MRGSPSDDNGRHALGRRIVHAEVLVLLHTDELSFSRPTEPQTPAVKS